MSFPAVFYPVNLFICNICILTCCGEMCIWYVYSCIRNYTLYSYPWYCLGFNVLSIFPFTPTFFRTQQQQSRRRRQQHWNRVRLWNFYPIGSMYGIFTYIWLIFMVFMYVNIPIVPWIRGGQHWTSGASSSFEGQRFAGSWSLVGANARCLGTKRLGETSMIKTYACVNSCFWFP